MTKRREPGAGKLTHNENKFDQAPVAKRRGPSVTYTSLNAICWQLTGWKRRSSKCAFSQIQRMHIYTTDVHVTIAHILYKYVPA